MTHEQMIEVIQAAKDGKQIQVRPKPSGEWRDCQEPSFNFAFYNYRIKPEPREWWVYERPGSVLAFVADGTPGSFKVREVIE